MQLTVYSWKFIQAVVACGNGHLWNAQTHTHTHSSWWELCNISIVISICVTTNKRICRFVSAGDWRAKFHGTDETAAVTMRTNGYEWIAGFHWFNTSEWSNIYIKKNQRRKHSHYQAKALPLQKISDLSRRMSTKSSVKTCSNKF